MKLFIGCLEEEYKYIIPFLVIFEELKIEIRIKKFRQDEDVFTAKDFQKELPDISHFFLIASKKSRCSLWYTFILGYCMNRTGSLFLFKTDIQGEWPEGLLFDNSTTPEEVFQYYRAKKIEWEKFCFVEEARKRIRDMGLHISQLSFSDAVREGNLRACREFLNAGFSADSKDKKGVTLLSLAVRNGHRRIIPLLLNHGADVNSISDDRGNTALMDAAARGDEELVSDFIYAGSDLNLRSKDGQTALILAIGTGSFSVADRLIRAGCNLEERDNLGMQALDYARLFKKSNIIRILEHAKSGSRQMRD